MTIKMTMTRNICGVCGYENFSDAKACFRCGLQGEHKEDVSGLSNPSTFLVSNTQVTNKTGALIKVLSYLILGFGIIFSFMAGNAANFYMGFSFTTFLVTLFGSVLSFALVRGFVKLFFS